MPPPASFITVTSHPFSRLVTQAEFNVANEIWFKLTADSDFVFGIEPNFEKVLNISAGAYQADGTTLIRNTTGSRTFDIEVLNGLDYYVRLRTSVFGAIASDFT